MMQECIEAESKIYDWKWVGELLNAEHSGQISKTWLLV